MMQGSFIAYSYSHNLTPETQNVSSLQDANEESKSVTKASAMKGKAFLLQPLLICWELVNSISCSTLLHSQ